MRFFIEIFQKIIWKMTKKPRFCLGFAIKNKSVSFWIPKFLSTLLPSRNMSQIILKDTKLKYMKSVSWMKLLKGIFILWTCQPQELTLMFISFVTPNQTVLYAKRPSFMAQYFCKRSRSRFKLKIFEPESGLFLIGWSCQGSLFFGIIANSLW